MNHVTECLDGLGDLDGHGDLNALNGPNENNSIDADSGGDNLMSIFQ